MPGWESEEVPGTAAAAPHGDRHGRLDGGVNADQRPDTWGIGCLFLPPSPHPLPKFSPAQLPPSECPKTWFFSASPNSPEDGPQLYFQMLGDQAPG